MLIVSKLFHGIFRSGNALRLDCRRDTPVATSACWQILIWYRAFLGGGAWTLYQSGPINWYLLGLIAMLSGDSIPIHQEAAGEVVVVTLAGSSRAGDRDAVGGAARFYNPAHVAVDDAGNIYVADYGNQKIRKVTEVGSVSTLAGSGIPGDMDGVGEEARFQEPSGVAVDNAGNVYVADRFNHKIRKVTEGGVVSTLAGSGIQGSVDGPADVASFSQPADVAVDGAGNVYVADFGNHKIRKVTPDGLVSTLAGSGSPGSIDGSGGASKFREPSGVAVDDTGNVYVADAFNHKIRKVAPDGLVSTFAGSGIEGSEDGIGAVASFSFPVGVAVDTYGCVFVVDGNNHKIRKITATGAVSTLAGNGSQSSSDGAGDVAGFSFPVGVAVDDYGNVYVGDNLNQTIRKILVPPKLFNLPAEQTIVMGTNLVLSVSVVSSSPVGYQWYSNAVGIVGGSAATLTLGAAQLEWSGTYAVVVTNSVGATTNSVQLVVEQFGSPHVTVAGTVPGVGSNVFGGSAVVTIDSAFDNPLIRYSLDGVTLPSLGGPYEYTGSFSVTNNVIVRAVAFDEDLNSAMSAPVGITIVPTYTLNLTTAGGFRIELLSEAGRTYVMEANVVMLETNWVPVLTNMGTGDLLEFLDGDATNFSQRFYRVRRDE